MIVGGLRALRQHDLKLLLAFGTVSQLGFLVVLFGVGTPAATAAGCVMLLAHALFKAALFMAVGTVDRHTGTRDLRRIPALGAGLASVRASSRSRPRRRWPASRCCSASSPRKPASTRSLHAGVRRRGARRSPASSSARRSPSPTRPGSCGACSAPTVAVGAPTSRVEHRRLRPSDRPDAGLRRADRRARRVTVVLGVVPALARPPRSARPRRRSTRIGAHGVHLALWHGFNLALLLSVVALAGGAGCCSSGAHRSTTCSPTAAAIPSGTVLYTRLLRGTNTVATRLTGVVQNGSLPVYAGVILLTAALVPGLVLLTQTDVAGLAAMPSAARRSCRSCSRVLGAAIAAAAVRRRFSAALFLGIAGYAMAGLFVVQGAPDLALTQVAIETLSTVLFVLVLRRLPDRFERTSTIAAPRRPRRHLARWSA